ncbi:hypothetical protein RDV64_05755 [Acuticoccus sp. MNP-M23]|uniref:hypothetical protein n=1 Tax=Acuticoccus sp. MNP-M23 TaxID=3072793 RepID=UPI002815936F|nr:hypothetical protein [Acuticoccus sp. MNP-M23]WMS43895.1 hypothetical protein RDV64_05755 [Acuticoccus sp. MNP-M23]
MTKRFPSRAVRAIAGAFALLVPLAVSAMLAQAREPVESIAGFISVADPAQGRFDLLDFDTGSTLDLTSGELTLIQAAEGGPDTVHATLCDAMAGAMEGVLKTTLENRAEASGRLYATVQAGGNTYTLTRFETGDGPILD